MVANGIEFRTFEQVDVKLNKKCRYLVVCRDGKEVATLPDASRLERAMALSLEETEDIARNFTEIMKREPSEAEKAFWEALVEYKRKQASVSS